MDQNEKKPVSFASGAFSVLLAVLVLCGICLLIASFAGNDKQPTGTRYLRDSLHVWNTGVFPKPEEFLADRGIVGAFLALTLHIHFVLKVIVEVDSVVEQTAESLIVSFGVDRAEK